MKSIADASLDQVLESSMVELSRNLSNGML